MAILPLRGQQKHQVLFQVLHQLSLTGMNVGTGKNTDSSGEEEALKYVRQKFQDQQKILLFDVGANVGKYSLLLRKIFGEKGSICAFEPSLKTFQQLQSNLANNNNIALYQFGLGNENSTTLLYSDGEASGLASVYKRKLDHFNVNMNSKEEVEIKTLDVFCQEQDISHIHFLKLDVEGHELKVLEGANAMLKAGKIDFIQFEFGGTNIDSRTFFQDFYYLLKDQYKLYRIVKDGLFLIETYTEAHEFFITTNYLAEKRP